MSAMSITKDEVSDLITFNNQQMMDSFKALLQDTVGQIKRANEDAADLQMKEIKKLKHSEPHKFNRKVNEDQYKFNLKLGETLDNAKSAAQKSQLEKVKSELDEGEKLLLERQKHILLADKSESGWLTVEEYKKHDLAENSDDEKWIFSAERRARATLSTLKKKRSSSFAASRRSALVCPSAPVTSSASSQQQPQAIQSLVPSSFTVRRLNMGSCFACGKPGHWRSTCPAMAKQLCLLQLQSDFKIRINQVLLIPFLIIMIWLWKRKMTVLQIVILSHFVLRFILSFWIRWLIHSLRLIFPVSPRCEEGLNCVFFSGVL